MSTRELIEILTDVCNMKIKEIGKELGISRYTIYNWSKRNTHIEELKEFIKSKGLNTDEELRKISNIKFLIKNNNWSDLLRGILFDLKMRQLDLSKKLKVNQSLISSWIKENSKPKLKYKIRLLSLIKTTNQPIERLVELGRKVKNSILVEGRLVDKRDSVKRSEINEELFVVKDNKTFINTPLLFPYNFHGNELKFVFKKDSIIVFWENKNKEPHPLVLPRLIEINDTLLIGLGIWIAEGTKTKRKPKVTNSEPTIMKQAIKFFEHIGIDRLKLNGWIQIHERSPLSHEKEKLINFWSTKLGLQKQQIKNVFIKADKSTSIKKVPVKQFGTFHLECNLIISRLLIDGLLSSIEQILKAKPNSELFLLKGIFCGEGWCGLAKTGSINQVTITFKDNKWRKLTLKMLSKIGINSKENEKKYKISIYGWKNFKRLVKLDVFEFNPDMKTRLEMGFNILNKNNVPHKTKG
jgi:DNA-binding XRE family transcriptional regulator